MNRRARDEAKSVVIYILSVGYAISALFIICKLIAYKCTGNNASGDTIENRRGVLIAMKVLIIRGCLTAFVWLIIGVTTRTNRAKRAIWSNSVGPEFVAVLFSIWWYMSVKKWVVAKEDHDAHMEKVRAYQLSLQ